MGFLVAPTSAALFPFVGACAGTLIFNGKCDIDFGWSPFALAITFPATALVAVPLFILFCKRNWLEWWQIALGGAIVGLVSPVILQVVDDGSNWVWYRFALISVPLGILSSLVFWYIAARNNLRSVERVLARE